MIPKFVEAAISELQAMWPEGEHFPTMDWDGTRYRLKGKRHFYRTAKCPLELYRDEINHRIAEFARLCEDDSFVPVSPFDKLLNWYKPDWSKFSVAFECITNAELDYKYNQYINKRKSEGGC